MSFLFLSYKVYFVVDDNNNNINNNSYSICEVAWGVFKFILIGNCRMEDKKMHNGMVVPEY